MNAPGRAFLASRLTLITLGICFRWTAAGTKNVEIVDYH
jgi:hypothetical protein